MAGQPPRGMASHHPRGTQPTQGMQTTGTVLGPHTDTAAPTARGWRTPTARPVGVQLGEGQRLTSDAPHTMVEGTPPGDALPPPPQQATPARKGARCGAGAWSPRPHRPQPGHMGRGTLATRSRGQAAGGGTAPDTRRPSQWWKAPPKGDALPPPPQRATPARKGARCGAGAGSQRPHRPHPGHTGHGTPAARSRRRAAGGGTAPDTKRPSQRWQATPPGEGPPPAPGHAAPTGHTGQGDSVGPPHPHTRAHSTWVADPNSPPSGWAVGGGGAPNVRRPSQRWKAHPPRMPFRHPLSEQRRPARAHAVGPVLGPHARTDCPREARVAEPRLPAPEDGRLGEGQRLTPDAPHNGGRPPPPGTAPHQPRGTQPPQGIQAKGTVLGPHTHTPAPTGRGWRTPTARPVGGQSGEGQRLTWDAPQNGGRHPPRGCPSASPTASNAGPQGRTLWCRCWVPTPATATRDTWVAEPWLPAQEDGRPGEGQRLTPDAPHNGGKPAPPGTAPHHPRGTQPPQGMQAKGTVLGPHTDTPAPTARGWRTSTAGPVGGQSGEGEHLTSDAPHTMVEGTPPRGLPSASPTASNAGPQGRTLWNRCWVPTPTPTAPGTHGSRYSGCPPQRTGGWGRDGA